MIVKVRECLSELSDALTRRLPESVLDVCLSVAVVREAAIDEGKRQVVAVITDPSIDSYEESIAVGAFEASLAAYMVNPCVLPAHQHRLANGHPASVGQILEITRMGESLVARMQFGETEIGQQHWLAYKARDMRAFSVGFRPIKGEKVNGYYTYTEAMLREVSAVAVPANGNALVLDYVTAKLAGLGSTPTTRGEDEAVARLVADVDELRAEIDALRIGDGDTGVAPESETDDADSWMSDVMDKVAAAMAPPVER
jgi:HK97 family phage prohead protease